jgi:hypothetical protein
MFCFSELKFLTLFEIQSFDTERGIKMYVVQQRHSIVIVSRFVVHIYKMQKTEVKSAKITEGSKRKRGRMGRSIATARGGYNGELLTCSLCYVFMHNYMRGKKSRSQRQQICVRKEATTRTPKSSQLVDGW